ncbi:MAG: glycosyltransferase family 9 protein [Lentimicrobium sp.]|nr:glycosyltransferase family 9 protein [Lentimicrobium sp.]
MQKKILIIRFSSIGDIVLTSPVVRCLSRQLENVEIHYLTKEVFAPVLLSNPHISRVFTIRKNVSEVLPELRVQRYDYIIDLHNNLRSWQVLLGLRRSFSRFSKLNFRKWLLVTFKAKVMPDVHIVDRYMQTATGLGIKNDGAGLEFYIPKSQEIDINVLPAPYKHGFITLVTGGRHFTKIIPIEKAVAICRLLKLPVVLLGGPEDRERAETIANFEGVKALNVCGKYSLMASASLVRQAKAIITSDTGLMHIAAAFHKPIVSVWGNTVPELGMHPLLPVEVPQMISEVNGLKCRPCSKIGFATCPKGHFRCMMDQDVAEIAGFVNNL